MKIIVLLFAGALLLVGTPDHVLAQADTARIGEAADTFELRELVVTATRMPVPRAAVPSPVTVLTGSDLRARGIARVADALTVIPGVDVVETGSWGGRASLFVRGGESDYVQVLVDGVPVNATGGSVDLATLSVDDIERIEVVRGPASVLYGSDAVTGVVQLFTRAGEGPTRISASARGGTYGTSDLDASAGGGAGPFAWSLTAGRYDTDGLLEVNNAFRNDVVSGRLALRPGGATDASLSVRHTDAAYHYPTDGAGRIVDQNAVQSTEQTTAAFELARAFGDRFRGTLRVGGHRADIGIDDLPDDAEDPDLLRYRQELRRVVTDLQGDVHLGDASVLTVGGVLSRASETSATHVESSFGPFDSQGAADRDSRGLYAQVLTRALPRLSITGGARLEDSETFGGHATWRGGAVLSVAEGVRLRTVVGTGFKEPTLVESFGIGTIRGNPELEPEESRSWEVGAEADLAGERVRLSGTWFDQRFTNLIDFTFAPPSEDDPNYFNVAGATSRGLELGITVAPLSGVTITSSYTYLDTEATDPGFDTGEDAQFAPGQSLLRRPTHAAALRASWSTAARGGYGLAVRWTGERVDQDFTDFPPVRVTLPSYTLLDAWGSYPVLAPAGSRPGVELTLRVENLLDEAYENPANFPGRGRTVLAGVRMGIEL